MNMSAVYICEEQFTQESQLAEHIMSVHWYLQTP